MAPNRAGRIFFLLIQTLPTFWAERIWILRTFIFFIFWTPNFWISRFPDFQNLAWAGLGPWAGLGSEARQLQLEVPRATMVADLRTKICHMIDVQCEKPTSHPHPRTPWPKNWSFF